MNFIELDYGLVRKDAITGLIRENRQYHWNGDTHYDIAIHIQGTEVRLEYDSERERRKEFDRIVKELEGKDC